MHYCFFLLIKKILLIERIDLTYKLKNYRPLIKYIFKHKKDYLDVTGQEEHFNDPSIFPENFMEIIYQTSGNKEGYISYLILFLYIIFRGVSY